MRILGLDTATAATAVSLLDTDGGLEVTRRDDPPVGERPRHATRLLGLIAASLAQAGGGWESLDRIAVGLGPGTFTGLRIGIATARALAQARGIQLVGISTLRSLALNAERPPGDRAQAVLVAIDARRGEAFAAAWTLTEAGLGAPLLEPVALGPETLAAHVRELGTSPLAIGSGAIEFRPYLERAGAFIPGNDSVLHNVTALNHCRLAAAGESVGTRDEIKPHYLRLPDAELAHRRRATQ